MNIHDQYIIEISSALSEGDIDIIKYYSENYPDFVLEALNDFESGEYGSLSDNSIYFLTQYNNLELNSHILVYLFNANNIDNIEMFTLILDRTNGTNETNRTDRTKFVYVRLIRTIVHKYAYYLSNNNTNTNTNTNDSKEFYLVIVNHYENAISLHDFISLLELINSDAYNHLMMYFLFRIIRDNDELRFISSNSSMHDRLMYIATNGGAPKILVELLLKYRVGDYRGFIYNYTLKIMPFDTLI